MVSIRDTFLYSEAKMLELIQMYVYTDVKDFTKQLYDLLFIADAHLVIL